MDTDSDLSSLNIMHTDVSSDATKLTETFNTHCITLYKVPGTLNQIFGGLWHILTMTSPHPLTSIQMLVATEPNLLILLAHVI
jgi:hypothetical protein